MTPAAGPSKPFTALVMAGGRPDDPLARATGVAQKPLLPVAGVPMLVRVLGALRAARHVDRLVICGLDPALARLDPVLSGLECVRGGATPGASAALAITTLGLGAPVLITTADHPLLSGNTVDEFCAASLAEEADVTFGVVPAAAVTAAFPGIRRTRYRFREGAFCGCNLYGLLTPSGCTAPAAWTRVEQHRKQPWRMVGALGVGVLLRFLLGHLALADITALAQSRFGLRARAVRLSEPAAGFDVDTIAQLQAAETYLEQHARPLPK